MAELTLTEVETAIQSVQTDGQTVVLDGVSFSRANLSALVDLRERMLRKQERSSSQRPLFRGFKLDGMGY